MGSAKVSDLGWPFEGHNSMSKLTFGHVPVWPNSENWAGKQAKPRKFIHPPKIETTSTWRFCHFEITGQVTKNFLGFYGKADKIGITLFSFRAFAGPIDPESRRIHIAWSPEVVFVIAVSIISYSKNSILIFPSYLPMTQLFPTSYPITESEFSHTVMCWPKSCIISPFQPMAVSSVAENTISLKSRSEVVPYDVIALWTDLTRSKFFAKSCAKDTP